MTPLKPGSGSIFSHYMSVGCTGGTPRPAVLGLLEKKKKAAAGRKFLQNIFRYLLRWQC